MALSVWTDQQVLAQLDSGNKWGGATITYAFATNSSSMYTGSGEATGFSALTTAQQASAELSLTLWDDLIARSITKVAPGASYTSTNLEFGNTTSGIGYAHAYYPSVGSVWFNSSYGATSGTNSLMTPTIGQHGFLTFVHEIGHALGLDHMGEYNGTADMPSSFQDSTVYSIMSYFGPSWGSGSANGEGLVAWADWVGADGRLYSPQTPMLNDIMAIQSMYGVDTTTRTGDTVYGFNSNITGSVASIFNFVNNKNPILTIFDSAGVDTLDLSGFATSSTINIASGAFTSCNSMTNNIAIAYTCSIENAVGGSAADIIYGNLLANSLYGGAGNDSLFGYAGNDRLYGGAGNDAIDGGEGVDYVYFDAAWSAMLIAYDAATMTFSFSSTVAGADKVTGVEYFVDSNNVIRAASELGAGTPPPVYSGVASIAASTASILEGSSGSKVYEFVVTLSAASASTASVQWALSLSSGSTAASAADFTGAQSGTLTFAAGQTSAKIQVFVAGDTTFENNETFSVVLSNPSSGMTLGTALASGVIANDDGQTINGTNRANVLSGSELGDFIYGFGGGDTIYGNGGADYIDGGAGADIMYGGLGDDTYVVESSNDRVFESVGQGTDTVRTNLANYTLGAEVENLVYTGTSAFVGTGNALANQIVGAAGADRLNGGAGSDVLTGGAGRDTFDFSNVLNASNVDTITDFNAVDDTIRLKASVFTGLGSAGTTLSAAAFAVGAATTTAQKIIYDQGSGSLFYDADGSGAGAAIKFAVLTSPTGTITNADFLLY